ncbi:hypothetical protein AB4Z14_18825 [Terrabacter sp. 2TAF16]
MSSLDADDSGWRRLALYILVMAVSVLAPGAIILSLSLLWLSASQTLQVSGLTKAMEESGSFSSLFLTAALSLSFIFGYTARALGFRLVRGIEATQDIGTQRRFGSRVRSAWSKAAKRLFHGALEGDTCGGTYDSLEQGYGSSVCREALRLHPAMAPILKPSDPSHLLRDRRFDEVFVYAKLWLRRMAPPLNIDSVEVEVNILCASVIPIALSAPIFATMVDVPAYFSWPLAVIFAFLIVFFVIENALKLRKSERYEAFRNVVADCAMRLAAESFAKASNTAPAASPATRLGD